MKRYRVRHRSDYDYNVAVSNCQSVAHLTPRQTPTQRLLAHEIIIFPETVSRMQRLDYFGNPTLYFTVEEPHVHLEVHAHSEVELLPRSLADPLPEQSWEAAREALRNGLNPECLDARAFTLDSTWVTTGAETLEYAQRSFPPGRNLFDCLLALTERIHRDFQFDPTSTTVSTPVEEVLRLGRGVCQDFAHLEIACIRSLGLPARYISGYLETLPPPGRPKLVGSDASHAWVSAFIPGYGWLDLDPTNNQIPHLQHITIAWGRDYMDVAPLRGVLYGGGEHSVQVAVDVESIPLPHDVSRAS